MGRRLGLFPVALLATALACAGPPRAELRADDVDPVSTSYKLAQAGDTEGAVRAMKSAVQAEPRSYFRRVRLAWLLLATDAAGAFEHYQRAAQLEPGAIEPLLGEQQALVALGRWDAAEKVGRELLSRDPASYYGQLRLGWTLYSKKEWRAAADVYGRLAALYPGDADARLGLASSLHGAGRRQEAASAYRAVLAMVPGHATAMAGLAALERGK